MIPDPKWGDVWAFNTRHAALGTPKAEIYNTFVTLFFGDGSCRTVTPEYYQELLTARNGS